MNTEINNFCVYMHIAPNGKRYVGITCQKLNRRWHGGHGYRGQKYFWNAIKKYGWDNFQHIVVAENLTKEQACELEIDLIKFYKSNNSDFGYNLSSGGEFSFSGAKLSAEARKKIGDANRGENHYLYGKHPTEEHRKNMSLARMGEKNGFYGKHHTKESKEKMGKMVVCIETGVIYPTITEAQNKTGIDKSTIVKVCKGKKELAGFMHWKYYEE